MTDSRVVSHGDATCRNVLVALVAVLNILSGCTRDGTTVQDEATEFQEGALGGDWTLTDADVIHTIGEAQGLLIAGYGGDLMVLDDSTIVLANGQELVALDIEGNRIWTSGGSGSGPGEFGTSPLLFQFGDGFGAFDRSQGRFSLFDRDGNHLRTALANGPLFSVLGAFDSISVVGIPTVSRSSQSYARYSLDGLIIDTIAVVPVPEALRIEVTGPNGRSGSVILLCSPQLLATTLGSTLYVADAKLGIVSAVFSRDQTRQVHEVRNRRPITEELRASILGMLSEASPEVASDVLSRYGDVGDPQPSAWAAMLSDPEGRLWMRVNDCGSVSPDPPMEVWEVVDTSGVYLGRVSIPGNYGLRAIRGNIGVAYTYDSLDVASIKVLRIPIEY